MKVFYSRSHRIGWGQCDPAGIVYSPHFFDMFAENFVRLFEAAGYPKKRDMLTEMGLAGFPLLNVSASFVHPVLFGDDVLINSAAPDFGGSSMTIQHELVRDGLVCATCTEKRIWAVVDATRPDGLRAERVPDAVRARFLSNG